ncbi:FAD/NAD(P)-binding domain-containing protein [Hesseltinella vesiculosa]|uniref:FAD/NAD(P)-binding domain-containing protein n=1 Tax=Hesseltinella vesiculosa TaxID=101127 RepID=A0A1X2GVM3_9FUNG|nr:FAD/NAD(P)-binding domain-containing protein [Hesseltinella vesiculosa]
MSYSCLVIGAGFSGICSAIQLQKQLGITADIVESTSSVGGTWHTNTYPGCQCDIPSHLYSFSFELNSDWSAYFSPQPEIWDYLRRVAQKYDLYRTIQFNTTVQRAEWDVQCNMWKVIIQPADQPAYTKYYHFVFSCIGGLRIPQIPDQFTNFSGQIVHTAQWNSNIDFKNKTVAVIGNGASAVQALPQLQKLAKHVFNFQRTPTWVSPREQFSYSQWAKLYFRWVPFAMRFYRWFLYWQRELRFQMIQSPDGTFARKVREIFTQSIHQRLHQAGRQDLIPILLPKYSVGCKRITQSEDFYEALCQSNVTVIPHGATRVDGNKVIASNDEVVEADILVLATGFQVHNRFGHFDIVGRNGVSLKDLWDDASPVTYKSVSVANYPNYFMMLGPGSALGHNSVVCMIEHQVNYAVACIKRMQRYNLAYIEPKQEAAQRFTDKLNKDLQGTAWLSGCSSWYLNKHGVASTVWSGTVTSFWWTLKWFAMDDYHQTKATKSLFSGICAAIQVEKEFGVKATIFEALSDLGGTWWANQYPGAACDVPSHLYSLSFEKNPNWSERFSCQSEIHAYLQGVARKYNLYDQAMLNTEVVSADWQEAEKKWKLTVRENGAAATHAMYFDAVFAGLGPLRVANIPKEFKDFQGPIVHTASWDSSLDFTGKRIAVVGSGASAVQAIPKLQPVVAHLTNYMRTPTWCKPRRQYHYSTLVKFIFRWIPFALRLYRFSLYFRYEVQYLGFRYYNTAIGKAVRANFLKQVKRRCMAKGRPDMYEKLMPTYEVGCRRITPSECYIESLCESNVYVDRSGVASVNGRTITSKDGHEDTFDILVLATGFNTVGFLGNLQVNGRDNVNLNKLWDENYPDTYKTVGIHGFPNFYMLLGPGSALGHNSVVTMIEIQVANAIKCLKQLRGNVKAIEPTLEAQNSFVAGLKKNLSKTVWATNCGSWYTREDGQVFSLWSGPVFTFYWLLRNNDFHRDFIKHTSSKI